MNVYELHAFGTKVSAPVEEQMTGPKWVQTAKDLPLVIGASAVGWGVGKTLADAVAKRHAGPGPTPGAQYLPLIGNVLSAAAGYAAGRVRNDLRDRRAMAEQGSHVPG